MPQQRVITAFNSQTKADLITLIDSSVDELVTLGEGDFILTLCLDACNNDFYATVTESTPATLKGNMSTYINAIPCASLSGSLNIIYTYS